MLWPKAFKSRQTRAKVSPCIGCDKPTVADQPLETGDSTPFPRNASDEFAATEAKCLRFGTGLGKVTAQSTRPSLGRNASKAPPYRRPEARFRSGLREGRHRRDDVKGGPKFGPDPRKAGPAHLISGPLMPPAPCRPPNQAPPRPYRAFMLASGCSGKMPSRDAARGLVTTNQPDGRPPSTQRSMGLAG